ncbi:hypothetical protein [Actinomyces procaprae]|uniref:hypothetical protein n=1 Tax=Actinomyces procaprae TaxID=2560010 RepID=UPI0010A2326F|nr:hypothetical protein [Actinomyces procaprae]
MIATEALAETATEYGLVLVPQMWVDDLRRACYEGPEIPAARRHALIAEAAVTLLDSVDEGAWS